MALSGSRLFIMKEALLCITSFDNDFISIFHTNDFTSTIAIGSHQNRGIPYGRRFIWFVLWRIHYAVHQFYYFRL